MTLTQLIDNIKLRLNECMTGKYTGQVKFEINMKEGGIGTVAVRENKIEWLKK